MIENIFDLDFSRWNDILLSLVPALINAGIFIYITFFLPHNRTNNSFSVFVLLAGLWQAAEGFARMSVTADASYEWSKISEVVLLLVIPFGILFNLHFSQWYKKIPNNLIFPLLFFPAIVLLFFVITRLDKFTIVKSEYWHWIANPEPTIITSLIYAWITIGALLMLALPWLFYAKAADELKRKQSLLIALGFTLPVMVGIIVEIIFPLVLRMDNIPVAASLVTVFSITALVAITKYKLLDITPMYAFPTILDNMNEGIIIANNDRMIQYVNKKFCQMLEYNESELMGKNATDMLVAEEEKNFVEGKMKLRKAKIADRYELLLKTKSGKKICCEISGSPYLNSNGKIIGSIGIHTDLTEQKRNTGKLLNAEVRFLNVLQTSQDAVILSDAEEKIVFWNKSAERLFGYRYEEVAGENIALLMPQQFREENKNSIIRKKNGDVGTLNKTVEYMALRKDGTEFPIEHSLGKWEEENHVFYSRIIRDISGRRKAEEAQKLFRTLIDHTSDAVEVIDPDTGRFLDGNEKAWSELGYTREEFLSLSVFDIDPMVDPSKFVHVSEELQKSGTLMWEGIHRKKDGSTFPVEVNIRLIRLDREYIVTNVRDIIERNKMMNALYESEKKYRAFTESSLDAICAAYDEGKKIFYSNPAFCKMLGYSPEEVLQLTSYDIVAHPKENIDAIHQTVMVEKYQHLGERIWKKKNGELIFVDVNAVRITQNGKDIIYLEARDLTEKKIAEGKLKKSEEMIRNYASHLNKTLEDERSYIAKEIHDEIGQLLTGIKLGLTSLKKKIETPSLNGEIGIPSTLGAEGKITALMQDVDNSMQKFRKISTELRPGILDTLGLIPSIKWLGEEFEKKTGIKCKVQSPPPPEGGEQGVQFPPFGGIKGGSVSTCFFRICQESLTNISKHAEASEVVIEVKQEKAPPQPSPLGRENVSSPNGGGQEGAEDLGRALVLRISDNGKGIASEKLENPFSMGLLGMRERAKAIGATLLIESKINAGTSIILNAPILNNTNSKKLSDDLKTITLTP